MGFADSRGDKNYNKDLSGKRAEAVKNYLVDQRETLLLRPRERGTHGRSQCLWHPMPQPAGRQENRRVEIAVRTR